MRPCLLPISLEHGLGATMPPGNGTSAAVDNAPVVLTSGRPDTARPPDDVKHYSNCRGLRLLRIAVWAVIWVFTSQPGGTWSRSSSLQPGCGTSQAT